MLPPIAIRRHHILALAWLTAWSPASVAVVQEPPPAQKALPEHAILAAAEGTWDATIRTYLAGPDAEPSVSRGSEVNEVLPGGLWLLTKFEGDFGGMKLQGRGQYGYDPVRKKYVGTWLDSTSTLLSQLEGDYEAKTRTLTLVGSGYDPVQKVRFTQRMATTREEDGSRVFRLYMRYEGQPSEAKFLEITYRKRL